MVMNYHDDDTDDGDFDDDDYDNDHDDYDNVCGMRRAGPWGPEALTELPDQCQTRPSTLATHYKQCSRYFCIIAFAYFCIFVFVYFCICVYLTNARLTHPLWPHTISTAAGINLYQ